MLAHFLAVVGLFFLVPGPEEKWYGTCTDKPEESWDRMAEEMMANFSRSSHPIFRASSAFERGEIRSKERERSQYTSMVAMKPSSCSKQLSIYEAIADLCDDVPKRIGAPGKLAALEHLEKVEIHHRPPLRQKILPMNSIGETYSKNTSKNSSNCRKT